MACETGGWIRSSLEQTWQSWDGKGARRLRDVGVRGRVARGDIRILVQLGLALLVAIIKVEQLLFSPQYKIFIGWESCSEF